VSKWLDAVMIEGLVVDRGRLGLAASYAANRLEKARAAVTPRAGF